MAKYGKADRKGNILLEKLLKRANEYDVSKNHHNTVDASKLTSSDDDDEVAENESQLIADCKLALEQTQALRMANPQLLRPEDYVRLMRLDSFLLRNKKILNQLSPDNNNDGDDYNNDDCNNEEECMVNIRCKCVDDSINLKLVNNRIRGANDIANRLELHLTSKGICSYVAFVTSYVIFLFMITLLLSRIGKI